MYKPEGSRIFGNRVDEDSTFITKVTYELVTKYQETLINFMVFVIFTFMPVIL